MEKIKIVDHRNAGGLNNTKVATDNNVFSNFDLLANAINELIDEHNNIQSIADEPVVKSPTKKATK